MRIWKLTIFGLKIKSPSSVRNVLELYISFYKEMDLCPQTSRHSVSARVCLLDDIEYCITTTASEPYMCSVIFCCRVQVTLCDYEMYSVKGINLQNFFEDCIMGKISHIKSAVYRVRA